MNQYRLPFNFSAAPDPKSAHPPSYDHSCAAEFYHAESLSTAVNHAKPRYFNGTADKKYPVAVDKDKQRLKTFNEAMENLQRVIPVRLPKGRKLQKKQTLQVCALVNVHLYV